MAAHPLFAITADLARDAGEAALIARIREAQAQLAVYRHDHDQKLDTCNRVLARVGILAKYYEAQGMSPFVARVRAQSHI